MELESRRAYFRDTCMHPFEYVQGLSIRYEHSEKYLDG